jgi:serine/threonine protein kinase
MDTRWHQIETIFNDAADIPPAERSAFLEKACRGDVELMKEVESLIAASEKSNGFMSGAIRSAAESMISTTTSPVEGERLGSYCIVREIGRGGMGAVYLAVRADDQYEKQVAIKLVKRGMDTERVLARFRSERQILASLDHPNIARLLDGGTTADGRPFLVMEYIQGEPITTYCNSRDLSIRQRCELFRQVCSAVQFAHQKLVVHRDIKPGNILVTEDGTPKLLDFGIAKLLDTRSTQQQTIGAHQLLTPDYASPEQVQGEPITTATDVYLLGGVLYELLTARCPHVFKTDSVYEIERVICKTDVDRPSTVVQGRLRRELSGDLDNILLTALRKEPDRRYRSVDQFSDDLRRYLTGLPVSARPDTIGYRTGKFIRRNALAVAAASLLAIAITSGVISTLYQARRTEEQRQQAEQARAVAENNQHRAEQESSRAEEARLRAEREQKRAEAQTIQTDLQRQKAERRFNQVHELATHFLTDFDAEIQKLQGSTTARRLLVKTALQYLDGLAKESQNNPSLQTDLAMSYEKIGDVQGNPHLPSVGDLDGALTSYSKALAIREDLPAKTADAVCDLIASHVKMSDALDYAGKTEQAIVHQQKAIGLANAALSRHGADPRVRKELARAYVSEADLLVKLGRRSDSVPAYRRAVDVLSGLVGANEKDLTTRGERATTERKLASVLERLQRDDEAFDLRKKSLEEHKRLLLVEPNNQNFLRQVMTSNLAMGDSFMFASSRQRRDVSKAIAYYQDAFELALKLSRSDPLDQLAKKDLALCGSRLGDAQLGLNFPDPAVRSYETAIKAMEELQDANPGNQQNRSTLANYYIRIATAYVRAGDSATDQSSKRSAHSKAESRLRQGLLLFKQAATSDRLNVADQAKQYFGYRDLGNLHFNTGRWAEALDDYQQALQLAAAGHARDPQDAGALHNYAEAALYVSRTNAKMGHSCADGGEQWRKTRQLWQQYAARSVLDVDELDIDKEAAAALQSCSTR